MSALKGRYWDQTIQTVNTRSGYATFVDVGGAFVFIESFTLGADASWIISFQPQQIGMIFPAPAVMTNSPYLTIQNFRAEGITGGLPQSIPPMNLNQAMTNPPDFDPIIRVDVGSLVNPVALSQPVHLMGVEGKGGVPSTGVAAQGDDLPLFPPGYTMALEIVNLSAESAVITFSASVLHSPFEHITSST